MIWDRNGLTSLLLAERNSPHVRHLPQPDPRPQRSGQGAGRWRRRGRRRGPAPADRDGRDSRHPTYLAPEQALGNTSIGPRADLYALGRVLSELLVGVPPYQADTPLGMLHPEASIPHAGDHAAPGVTRVRPGVAGDPRGPSRLRRHPHAGRLVPDGATGPGAARRRSG